MEGFSDISESYNANSMIQKEAGEMLLDLCPFNYDDDVLDLGCGTGRLTCIIRKKTSGRVVGIDPSAGMIKQAKKLYKDGNIEFLVLSGEDMSFDEEFDVIISNSALQWFKDPLKVLKNCFISLRPRGKICVQAPAKKVYSPNFVEAVRNVESDPVLARTFSEFKSPWFLLDNEDEYKGLFESAGFSVKYIDIKEIESRYTPEEVFRIFSTGATIGYLNENNYNTNLTDSFKEGFLKVVREAFEHQAGRDGYVNLLFYRLFVLAVKE